MAMRLAEGVQDDLMATLAEMPRSPGLAFYDRLQELLRECGFAAFVEQACKSYNAPRMGAPSLPPGRYFRMHMIGYFEGIDSERGIVWRCVDSFSLRDFLRLSNRDKVPDPSWLSRTRSRLPHEAERRNVLPSAATTPAVCCANSRMNWEKHSPNATGSRGRRTD